MVNRVVLDGRDDYKVNKNGYIPNITRLKNGITHSRMVIVANRYPSGYMKGRLYDSDKRAAEAFQKLFPNINTKSFPRSNQGIYLL